MSKKRRAAVKRKRKKKTVKRTFAQKRAEKSKVEELVKLIERSYGKLDTDLHDEDYLTLLNRIATGRVNIDQANKLIKSNHIAMGTATELFEGGTADYTYMSFKVGSFEDATFENAELLVRAESARKQYVIEFLSSNSMGSAHGRQWRVSGNHELFLADFKTIELPYDMRRWPNSVLRSYFQKRFRNTADIRVTDRMRSKKLLDFDPLVDKVHTIRRLNSRPSKLQIRRINREREANASEINPSYSAES